MEIDTGQLFAIIGEYEVRCRLAQAQLAELGARIGTLEAELRPVKSNAEQPLRVMPGWAPQREADA